MNIDEVYRLVGEGTPFSLSCAGCDAGMDIDTVKDAIGFGWMNLEYTPHCESANFVGDCPECYDGEHSPVRVRKKPVLVEAIQYTRASRSAVIECGGESSTSGVGGEDGEFYERLNGRGATTEGDGRLCLTDWLIRGVEGEFYPCRDSVFRATYDLAGDE